MSQLGMLSLLGFKLEREEMECGLVAHVVVAGEPVSKARARFTGYGSKTRAYTPKKTHDAEQQFGWAFKKVAPGWAVDTTSAFGVFAIFYPGTRQRRDVDNMTKLILDACNKLVWGDDMQVTEISGRVVFDDPTPRTEVAIYYVDRQPPAGHDCDRCGKRIRTYKSWGLRRFCSRACAIGEVRENRAVTCPRCGVEFTADEYQKNRKYCSSKCRGVGHRTDLVCVQCSGQFQQWASWAPTGPVLCSRECRVGYWRARPTSAGKGTCATCGGPTSRKEYTRCRPCGISVKPERARKLSEVVLTILEVE